MNKFFVFSLVTATAASTALATDLNLTVVIDGPTTVAPGAAVNYSVVGELTDSLNEGLALFGLDLVFDGGDLPQAAAPPGMSSFVRPDGITNPAGYGGTTNLLGREGDLIQIGGGNNSIKNGQMDCTVMADCPSGSDCVGGLCTPVAGFPVGVVMTGIALPGSSAVLATGTLTAPLTSGIFTLSIPPDSVFANVIKQGENGIPFWATEPAGDMGTITNATIEVMTACGGVNLMAAATAPACDASRPWANNSVIRLTFGSPVTCPAPGEVEIRELLDGAGMFGVDDLSGMFTCTPAPPATSTVLRFEENGTVLNNGTWYGILNTGNWCDPELFEITFPVLRGDANGDGFVNFFDLNFIFASVPSTAADNDPSDINRDGFVNFFDLNDAFSFIPSSVPAKPVGHDCSPAP